MKEFFEKYGLRILAIAAAAAVALSLLSFFASTSSLLHNAIGIITSPFRSAVSAVETWVEDKQRYYADYTELLEENAALKQELAELRQNERQALRDREENALLRELLKLQEQRRDFVFESAMILEHSSTNWTSTLTLNRGTNCGIAVKDCVVSAEGYLVGVVSEVGYNWATVLTVIDTDTELGALVFRTSEVAVAEGDFALMNEGRLKLSYLPESASLLSGDYIVTSGLGGYYPSNLVIGTVESVKVDDDGLAQYAVIAPMVDFDTLTEIFVIKDFTVID